MIIFILSFSNFLLKIQRLIFIITITIIVIIYFFTFRVFNLLKKPKTICLLMQLQREKMYSNNLQVGLEHYQLFFIICLKKTEQF